MWRRIVHSGQAPCLVAVPWAYHLMESISWDGTWQPLVQPSLKVKEPRVSSYVARPSSPRNKMGRGKCSGKSGMLRTIELHAILIAAF